MQIPLDVMQAYGLEAGDPAIRVVHIPSLINRTFLVQGDPARGGRQLVLQRLHPVFGAHVHVDIEAVTRHLQAQQLETPRLVPTRSGQLWTVEAGQGEPHVWRALTYVDGVTLHKSQNVAQLSSAAALLGRFHSALLDLQHEFSHLRPLHDTEQHLEKLRSVLALASARHDREAQELSARILDRAERVRLDFSAFPRRVLHGDPKLSNVLFYRDAPERARCMIDLDTLHRGYLAYELGDALRSWANAAGEDTEAAELDTAMLRAMLSAYARACPPALPRAEILSAIDGLETVALELSSRFAADAVLDSYFGWDATRFPSRRAHNLVRARGQLALSEHVGAHGALLREIAERALVSDADSG